MRLRVGDRSRSHDAVIRIYDEAGNVIKTHEHAGEFREPWATSVLGIVDRSLAGERSASKGRSM